MNQLTEPLLWESSETPFSTRSTPVAFHIQYAGVDLTRLRQFLPDQPSRFHSFLNDSVKVDGVEGTYNSSESLHVNGFSPINGRSSFVRTAHTSTTVTGSSFLNECDLQLNTLFAFIQANIESIQCQLKEQNDWAITSTESSYVYDQSGSTTSLIQDDTFTRKGLRENGLFCDRAFGQVQQLKNCLMVNLGQLNGIVKSYNHAYPKEKNVVEEFMAAKINTVYELTEKLVECQDDVTTHKEYLEARLTVVGWKDLMNPQHKQFTLFTLAHFIIFILAIAALAWFAGYRDRYIGLFYLYRGPMFLILYFYFYSLNLVGWATANIRYIDIFGFSSAQETPTPYIVFKVAGILSLTFTIFVSALIFTVQLENSRTPERILPIILWIITATVLINPFKWLIRKGRLGVFKVALRVMLAPFYPVIFGDFWFADQLSSIVIVFLDFEFMVCFYTYVWPMDKNEDGEVCNSNNYVVRPVIACLPAFWRFMQCLRCYYDTRHYSYLINAGKYSTTFPVVILFSLFSINRQSITDSLHFQSEGALFISWVLVSIINAMYTFIWDVYMDWGLLRSRNLLRPKLGYRWKSLYYLAIVEDFILRFAWSFRISLDLQLEAQVNLMYTLLAGLEIFRRFVWNFFRVEFEHVRVVSQFKKNNEGVLYMDSVF